MGIDNDHLQAWWWHKQGLDGSLKRGDSSAKCLARSGWARSVGGSNPYLSLWSRAQITRAEVDADVATLQIHELPSARGCTYVLPESHFALGLRLGQVMGDSGDILTAERKLGVPRAEIESLADQIEAAIAEAPLDPKALKDRLGSAVRNLGPEGKKRGITTTLPIALGLLQRDGRIRRAPITGRLDSQRYRYIKWTPNPIEPGGLSVDDAKACIAREYFQWFAPATIAQFKTFCGMTVRDCKMACESLDLRPIDDGEDLLILAEELDDFRHYTRPAEPHFNLVASLDNMIHGRRSISCLIDPAHANREAMVSFGLTAVGSLRDLENNAILDRGKIIGLWEYDPFEARIVWDPWCDPSSTMRIAVDSMQSYIRDHLGDAPSFSLDSPESRMPRLMALRATTPS